MKEMEAGHCCSVTLIVSGGDLDPEEVTKVLGMDAHQSWRRGDRKAFVRSDGTTQHFDGLNEAGGWKHFIPASYKNRSLHEQFSLWLARLQQLAGAIQALTARGWEVELDCFAIGTEVLVLPNCDLRKLAELGVGLALTLVRSNEQTGTQLGAAAAGGPAK